LGPLGPRSVSVSAHSNPGLRHIPVILLPTAALALGVSLKVLLSALDDHRIVPDRATARGHARITIAQFEKLDSLLAKAKAK
jgi:hypothetical protein